MTQNVDWDDWNPLLVLDQDKERRRPVDYQLCVSYKVPRIKKQ